MPPITLDTRFDTWGHWLIAAQESLERTEATLQKVHSAHAIDDDNALGPALEEEFRNSMATITAAASAVDAFYAAVKERYGQHPNVKTWKKTKLARYKQVAETLRWAWKLKPPVAKIVRATTKQLYNFRDPALHSPAEFRVMEHRQDIDSAVEWRFNWHRAENARAAVQGASELFATFLRSSDTTPGSIREWVQNCQEKFAAATDHDTSEPN